MSVNNAIAAQFWLWPDPVMKRDAQGRILFINAAFLSLYGGSVEAWTGNSLQGWPAPQPPQPNNYPIPYRFETRIPSVDAQQGEQVFDWIEQTDPDGTALALARNVTPFTDVNTQHAQNVQTAQTETQSQSATMTAQNVASQGSQVIQEQVSETYAEKMSDAHQTNTVEAFANSQPVAPHSETAEQAPQPAFQHEAVSAPAQQQAPQENAALQPQAEAQSEVEAAPTPPQHQEREERSFERRALPLEANSSVLGNNWRDAVIAKAVGGDESEAEANLEATPASVATDPAPATEQAGSSDGQKRILLAEDNAINALLTRTLLEAEGHSVETVEDGALAVEAMKTQSFDLIFMDMRMPNMDGLESTRKIRQLPNVPKSLPIIALTANAFDDDRNACFDSGMNDFMTKPVSADELTEMVKNWTGEKQAQMAS
jgi:CheY-like chemotaxis protein